MIVLKLSAPIKGLDKKPLEEPTKNGGTKIITIGNILASQFVSLTGLGSKEAMRLFKIASEMYDSKEISVDEEKFDFIAEHSEKIQLPVLYTGQILHFLRDAKETATDKKHNTKGA